MTRQTGFPLSVRVLIIDRAAGICEKCGEIRPGMSAHHRRVKGMGGSRQPDTNLASNGLWCCASCHHLIHANPELSYRHGWLVRQHEDPTEVAVMRFGRFVFLTADGGVEEVGVGDTTEAGEAS